VVFHPQGKNADYLIIRQVDLDHRVVFLQDNKSPLTVRSNRDVFRFEVLGNRGRIRVDADFRRPVTRSRLFNRAQRRTQCQRRSRLENIESQINR